VRDARPLQTAHVERQKTAAPPAPVKIGRAKGRPMLTWVGKRPLSQVTALPAQLVERYEAVGASIVSSDAWKDWPAKYPKGGLLFHGDNKEVLAHLLANGFREKVDLIYIDPPFDSGADYVRKVSLRGPGGTAKIDGESYTLGEQVQYTDIWANDNYLQFMYERLLLIRELLATHGTLYLHCDPRRNYQIRALLDEVFGADSVAAEIVWKRTSARSDSSGINMIHDTIYQVFKGSDKRWHRLLVPYSEEYLERFSMLDSTTGKKFQGTDLTARGLRTGGTGTPWRGFDPSQKGNHWLRTVTELDELDRQGKIYWPADGGWPRMKYFIDDAKGLPLQSIWSDIFVVNSQAEERTDYPTQKPESLLERLVSSSSNIGDVVLDCFMGSGTTPAVAQKLGRRWIGCDINRGAIQTAAKRLQQIADEQQQGLSAGRGKQGMLLEEGWTDAEKPAPAQLGFTVWSVNDYDLQIQHNEAVALACEHIGVQRTRSDSFFDGTLGDKLVKIVPFNHPLTPLDLEAVRGELDARPDDDRQIVMVCLGIEHAARHWLEDWNRLRKGKNAANRIDFIELRTDPKYGRFIQHQPVQARVTISRVKGRVRVTIEDFISPAILERLREQAGVVTPQIKDWRWLVDSIAIDPAYDEQVFSPRISDIPERKADMVNGTYEFDAPPSSLIAVRVTDMLGEEVLVSKRA
jgi:adenine-specific DNA-methyltransferase